MVMCMIIKNKKTQSWLELQDGVNEIKFILASRLEQVSGHNNEWPRREAFSWTATISWHPTLKKKKHGSISLPRKLHSLSEKTDNKTVC